MSISQREIDQTYSDLRDICGGVKEDYFGLLYIEQELDVVRERSVTQNAFGGNDYGIDGFHIDLERRNLYLLQFKWSKSYTTFKASYQRLIEDGMDRIFGNPTQDQQLNPLIAQLKSRLLNDMALIDRVFVRFVFLGDPEEAERSTTLDALRENLEAKKYLIDQFFERPMSLVIEYRSTETEQVSGVGHQKKTHTYSLEIPDTLERGGPNGQRMHIGFARLIDLHAMYIDMGNRFFERNIRAGLSETAAPNRAIQRSLKQILIDGTEHPSVFAFNHNGVTLSAQRFERVDGMYKVTEPRLLNGAQTVTTFGRFLELNKGNKAIEEQSDVLSDVWIPCRIITHAKPEFVISVTINNNRQNPVMPWNLRANDLIQCQIADKFRDDLGIYYERQEEMFSNMTDADLADLEITHRKAIELIRLTKTLLAIDGYVDRMSNMREAFENDNIYEQIFNEKRLQSDARKILLCYKLQFRLNRLVQAILEKGAAKYAFMNRARNLLWALLCQAMLNDKDLEWYCEEYGRGLVVEANYAEWLTALSTTRARVIIADVIKTSPYAENVKEENYSFLRTQAVFKKCMDIAHERWGWVKKGLK